MLPKTIRGLLIFLLLVVLLPVLIVQGGIYYSRYEDTRAQTLEANLELARAVAVAFDAYIRDVQHQELAIAVALTSRQTPSAEQVNRVLTESAQAYPSLREFFVMDTKGVVSASSNPQLIGVDASDREYFREISGGKEIAVSDLLQARVGGEPVFTIARGARDSQGVLLGVVVATVLPDRLDELALSMKRAGQGAIAVIDRQGMLVYRYPSADLSWEQRNQLDQHADLLRTALAGQDVIGDFPSFVDGHERLGGFAAINSVGWAARASRPETEAMAPVLQGLSRDVALLMVVALGAFGFALLVSRRLTIPVGNLQAQAQAFEHGMLQTRVDVSGPVELENLGRAFNKMAEAIKAQQEELQAQNEELVATNEALLQAQDAMARLAAIVESSDDAIIGKTLDGVIQSWNEGAERLYGYNETEAIGKPVAMLVPVDRPDEMPAIMERLSQGGTPSQYETERVRKDGTIVEVAITVSPIRDAQGQGMVVGASTIARDITERKRLERQLADAAARLQAQHEELQTQHEELQVQTEELQVQSEELKVTNVSLTEAQRALTESEKNLRRRAFELTVMNKELESFSYSVSHDLRAPLRSIDGFSLALLEDYAKVLDDQGKDYLQRVRAASQRMGQLIDDLLNLSRLTRGEMHREEVDLTAMVRSIAAELRKAEPERAVEFVIAPDVVASCDARLVRAALENLLGNSWKFTAKHDSATIEFGMTTIDGHATYFVRDDGAGFDMSYASKLFSAFQRLHRATEFPGTGIGLATVQRIVHRHGGRVWANAAPEQGATFFFTL